MIALSLTIFVSLGLAVFFIGLFLIQMGEGGGRPNDALLPMETEESAGSAVQSNGKGGAR
jgi:hypothetical protein